MTAVDEEHVDRRVAQHELVLVRHYESPSREEWNPEICKLKGSGRTAEISLGFP